MTLFPPAVAICLLLIGIGPLTVQAQVAQIAGSATTGLVLKQLLADLTNMINKARDDGDYLLARAGVEAKNALDAWQQANNNLLDKAFSELDIASRENFARAHQLIAAVDSPIANRLETVQQITENANQILESIPFRGRQTYVLRFSPRIQPPQAKDSFTVRIRGVNLDKGNPTLHLSNGVAKRDLTGPLEAQFTIPSSEIKRDPSKMLVHSFKLTYMTPPDSWFGSLAGRRDRVTREIPLVFLPINMATYEISVTRKFEKPNRDPFTRVLQQFKGTNTRQYQVAHPKEGGWKWDLSRTPTLTQLGGEAGRCEGVDMNQSSENGFSVYAQLDEIKNIRYPRGAPGYVDCALNGVVYIMEKATETLPIQNGILSWNADKLIDLPPDTDSFSLKVKTFDGRERIISGTASDKFFDVRREPKQLIVTPKVPEDIGT